MGASLLALAKSIYYKIRPQKNYTLRKMYLSFPTSRHNLVDTTSKFPQRSHKPKKKDIKNNKVSNDIKTLTHL